MSWNAKYKIKLTAASSVLGVEQLAKLPDAIFDSCNSAGSDIFIVYGATAFTCKKCYFSKTSRTGYIWFPGQITDTSPIYYIYYGGTIVLPNDYSMRESCVFFSDMSGNPNDGVIDQSEYAGIVPLIGGSPATTPSATNHILTSFPFNGSTKYSSTALNLAIACVEGDCTVDLIYKASNTATYQELMTLHSYTYGKQFDILSGKNTCFSGDGVTHSADSTLSNDVFYHYRWSFVRSTKIATFYKNGIIDGTEEYANAVDLLHGTMYIGCDSAGNNMLTGAMSHIAIYNEALGAPTVEYESLFNHDAFNTFGTVENVGGIVTFYNSVINSDIFN